MLSLNRVGKTLLTQLFLQFTHHCFFVFFLAVIKCVFFLGIFNGNTFSMSDFLAYTTNFLSFSQMTDIFNATLGICFIYSDFFSFPIRLIEDQSFSNPYVFSNFIFILITTICSSRTLAFLHFTSVHFHAVHFQSSSSVPPPPPPPLPPPSGHEEKKGRGLRGEGGASAVAPRSPPSVQVDGEGNQVLNGQRRLWL